MVAPALTALPCVLYLEKYLHNEVKVNCQSILKDETHRAMLVLK